MFSLDGMRLKLGSLLTTLLQLVLQNLVQYYADNV